MKKAAKAALWSIFIFPGGGHFFLKKPLPGTMIVVFTVAALTVVVIKAVERAMQIVEKVESGEIPFDPILIAEQVSMQSMQADSQLLDIAWYLLIAIWLFAAIDAYRRGRIADNDPEAARH